MDFRFTAKNKISNQKMKLIFKNLLVFCLLNLGLVAHAQQRIEMEGTAIIGNKESPKVLYIVPWKTTSAGELSAPEFTSVLDKKFTPIERSNFNRVIQLYQKTKIQNNIASNEQNNK